MHRLFAFVSKALPVVLVLALAAPAWGGYYYESQTSGGAGKQAFVQEVHGWVDGNKSKVEFRTGKKKDLLAPGNYLLTTDGGKTVFLVNPADKTYQVWDLAALFATMGTVMEGLGGVFELNFSDMSSEKLLEEGGGELLGHSTKHVRWRTGYTMEIKIIGIKQQHEVEIVQDSWLARGFTDAGFGTWLRKDRFKSGNESLDRLVAQEMAKIEGFPLKTVMVTTTRNKKGKESTDTTTTEVTALRQESVAASTFELPGDYKKIDPLAMEQ